jgi:hypothetical protein
VIKADAFTDRLVKQRDRTLARRVHAKGQGFTIQDNVCFQDNESAIRLGVNGRASASRRSRHMDIRFFYMKDLCDKKLVTIKYCPTDEMEGDFFTKPIQGKKFHKFRRRIMGMDDCS